MVKELAPLAITLCALLTVVFSLFGEDSYSRLTSLRKAVIVQELENNGLRSSVSTLREKITGLREDQRELEKAARNELGLARPDEQVFIFDKKPTSSKDRKAKS